MSTAFNWTQFLEKHGIPYTADKKERNAACRCPMCGDDQASHHRMAISLKGRGWKCWRDPIKHRGRSPVRLIQAFIRCSYEEACDIAGKSRPALVPDRKLSSAVSSRLGVKQRRKKVTARGIELPREFRRVGSYGGLNYLQARGYNNEEIEWLREAYQLRFARHGLWRYRLIIPILDAVGDILCWTGRTIIPHREPRYLTLTTDEELASSKGYPAAITPPPQTLLGLNLLTSCDNPDVMVICEGPFDAMRISAAGHERGVWGTCLFGLNISREQVDLISEVAVRFKKTYLVLDTDAAMRGFAIRQSLPNVKVLSARLSEEVKDPGDLSSKQASKFCASLL